jgi:hypothetical protein
MSVIPADLGQLFFYTRSQATEMNREKLLQFLIDKGQAWVLAQRDHHRPSARVLTTTEKAALSPFFEKHTLDIVRIKGVPVIENPAFYRDLEAKGVTPPLDFTAMEGITFVDTILISKQRHPYEPPLCPLLFHELVNVVQYAILGLPVFIDQYVRGWMDAGLDYHRIPMERDAYELQELYEAHPERRFSVEAEVKRQLRLA